MRPNQPLFVDFGNLPPFDWRWAAFYAAFLMVLAITFHH